MKLSIYLNPDELNEQISYAVIVENWDKRLFGRVKRAYDDTFTETEKRIIGSYYVRMYRWYLVTGPKPCHIIIANIHLLRRASAFFASI